MDRRHVAAAFVLGVLLTAGAMTALDRDAATGKIAVEVSELATGGEVELLTVEDRGTFDRVVLRPSGTDRVTELHVTSDGKYILQDPVSVENFTRRAESREALVSCLEQRNATFYGLVTSNRTLAEHARMAQLQFQVLGGVQQAAPVFGGPGEEAVRAAVMENGVVWRINGSYLPGVRTVGQLESLVGCRYSLQ